MINKIKIHMDQETYTLADDLVYTHVPFWYGETQRPLHLSLLMPKHREGHPRVPLIVWICGGAFRNMDRNVWIPQLTGLAKEGYVIASVEYRTSHEAPFPAALMDIKSAIRFLRAHAPEFCIDGERVYIMGESAGATLALLAGVTKDTQEFDQGGYMDYPSAVSKVVDFYGLADLLHDPIGENIENDRVIQDFLADDPDAWGEKASAINYIRDGIELPEFLILHGDQDRTVPVSQSEKLYERLKEAGQRAGFYILEGAGHGEDVFYQKEIMDIIHAFLRGDWHIPSEELAGM